jgi:ribosomal protein S18 acetylase RimI-like enzyme
VSCSLRPVGPAQRGPLEALVAATGLFRPAEVATAVELLDEALAGDDDYRFLGAYDSSGGDTLVGYACWGPTPGTVGTWDLYWIVVEPARQGAGVGTQLLREVARRLATQDARLLVVETSSRADYAPTRSFYERRGFTRAATIPGYYAPGDDLVLYTKDLTDGDLARAAP